jgi:hypothetical protein
LLGGRCGGVRGNARGNSMQGRCRQEACRRPFPVGQRRVSAFGPSRCRRPIWRPYEASGGASLARPGRAGGKSGGSCCRACLTQREAVARLTPMPTAIILVGGLPSATAAR